MTAKREPQFIIIGAVKAATTWSARLLSENPSLYVPRPEPHFFSTEYERGFEWYLDLFADAPEGVIIGEKSADYLAHPNAAERIAEQLPHAKLIVQLRNPVERAYSDYCMLYRRGAVRDTPDAYFASGSADALGDRFLNGGLYADHLSRFYDRFAPEQFLVLLYEDIKNHPAESLRRLSAHIGVDPFVPGDSLEERQNDSAAALLPLAMRKALRPLKSAAAPFRGEAWFEGVRSLFARKVSYPPLDGTARQYLQDYYEEDIRRTGRLIDRDLSAWSLSDDQLSGDDACEGDLLAANGQA